ncbi:hypothetical protein FXO38_35085 [Capsicum annuum]|uniref:Uncharacterized protein n=1 Tax=Capsicum annuum TaxID=4072 RepID=A0A2G2Y5S3_CAPAN|nr:hypothetical protein FXO38_35085 [Capsicum annuum]PHT65105.1 hypothetical protein T459_29530 [Capsicum annuum]
MLFLRPKNVFVQRVFLPGVKFGDRTLPAIVIAATLIYITFSSPSKRDGLGSAIVEKSRKPEYELSIVAVAVEQEG